MNEKIMLRKRDILIVIVKEKAKTNFPKQMRSQTIQKEFINLFPCTVLLLNFIWVNQIQAKGKNIVSKTIQFWRNNQGHHRSISFYKQQSQRNPTPWLCLRSLFDLRAIILRQHAWAPHNNPYCSYLNNLFEIKTVVATKN